jgi:manganese transport protein
LAVRGVLPLLGPVIATLFAVGLLASGLASTSVDSYAGAEIMHGLLKTRIPLVVRRLVTRVPALIILLLGVDPTWSLVLSRVFLAFGIPFALIPLVMVTARFPSYDENPPPRSEVDGQTGANFAFRQC